MRRFLLYITLGAIFIPPLSAPCRGQEAGRAGVADTAVQHTFSFSYVSNNTENMDALGDNATELSRMNELLQPTPGERRNSILRIRITGYASIEGDYRTNEYVARSRAENLQLYVLSHYPDMALVAMDIAWVAEDWDGLAKLVRASDLNERAEVLEIIRKIQKTEVREELLRKLNGGKPYVRLRKEVLPQLCRVEVTIDTGEPVTNNYDTGEGNTSLQQAEERNDIRTEPRNSAPARDNRYGDPKNIDKDMGIGTVTVNKPQGLSSLRKEEYPKGEAAGNEAQPVFAIKTNILLWAGVQHDAKYTTPVANVALEYYISDHCSIELGAMYSYWRYNSNQKFQGISGYRIEPRYCFVFPNNRFGAYLGLYGRVGDYDLRAVESNAAQPTVNYQLSTVNYTGDYWDAGVSAGVTLHLVGGLGLEIGGRAGYVSTDVMHYTVDGSKNRFTHKEPYGKIRVTDLNLSLIYRFR